MGLLGDPSPLILNPNPVPLADACRFRGVRVEGGDGEGRLPPQSVASGVWSRGVKPVPPVVRMRGYRSARSGRLTGLSGTSVQVGSGSPPAFSVTVDHSSNLPVGVSNWPRRL